MQPQHAVDRFCPIRSEIWCHLHHPFSPTRSYFFASVCHIDVCVVFIHIIRYVLLVGILPMQAEAVRQHPRREYSIKRQYI